MSQVTTPQVPSGSGLSVREGINAVLKALMSTNSGSSAPPNPVAGMAWFDTTTSDIKIRNAANTGWLLLSDMIGALEYDRAQSLTSPQQGQARANIDAGTFQWNWVINGDFTINQRGGVKKPANGVYGYDRWKGHANGIEQVVEALPAGEYTLTWTGGGTGTFGGVTGASPVKATVSGGNTSVVVPGGATKVSLVAGDATAHADPFSPRNIQQELSLCLRYYAKDWSKATLAPPVGGATNQRRAWLPLPVPMRANPSVSAAVSNISSPAIDPTSTGIGVYGEPGGDVECTVQSISAEAEL